MELALGGIVPWGRSYEEYVAMFALTADDLRGSILGCGDGPASFNAELTRRGGRVVSVDPLYQFSAEQIRDRVAHVAPAILEQVRNHHSEFAWRTIPSVEALRDIRMQAMNVFLDDYPAGCQSGRYLDGELPRVALQDRRFDLALCSHLLFLYSSQLPVDFHICALRAMLSVATEVRAFPLLTMEGVISPHLEPVLDAMVEEEVVATVENVPYEFQRGANQMLRLLPRDRLHIDGIHSS